MSRKELRETILAYATVALAVVTLALAVFTFAIVKESKDASFRQIGVQTWLEMEKRFDSPDMIRARNKLARQLLSKPVKHEELSETLFDFFEDLGVAYRKGYVEKDLADSSFSLYITRYWEAAKPFLLEDRRHYTGDYVIWENFEFLAKAMRTPGEKIDEEQIRQLLEDEIKLTVD